TGFEWDINFNTCNRTQLALYVAQTKDLIPFAANVAVELVMRLRTQKVFGEINREKVDRICGYCDELAKLLKSTATTLNWVNERISRVGSEEEKKFANAEGIKRAHYHEELATFILEKNLLGSTLRS
ncbi:MAG: hypothetical protein QOH87_420, partial [Trebonia sp.]|nr:hypothetical protein [Trebonia sp.]